MATNKSYGYQIKGNKISLVEVDYTGSGDGLNYTYNGTTGESTPFGTSGDSIDISSGSSLLKSPLTTVANGLEIEYAYSPEYYYNTSAAIGTSKFSIHGWIIVDGYLAFVHGRPGGGLSWAGTLGYSTPTSDKYILVKNSSRWNGIHKIQELQSHIGDSVNSSHCAIKTHTKVSVNDYKYWTGTPNIDSTSIIVGPDMFEVGDYVWQASGNTSNIGLYRVSSVSDHLGAGIADSLTLDIKVHNKTSQYYAVEHQESAVSMNADTDGTTYVYQAFRESPNTHIILDVDVLSDESDNIDLPPYLSKALVYYVKAKVAEDRMDIEAKEYMMKEFRKMLEKHESSKVAGPRMIMSGPSSIR